MNPSVLEDLRSAATEPELLSAVLKVGHSMDFGLVSIGYRTGPLSGKPRVRSISNPSEGWRERHNNLQLAIADPVFTKLQYSREPFLWDADTYSSVGLGPAWEEGAPFGYSNGVAGALQLAADRTIFWGFDRQERMPQDDRSRIQMLGMTQLVGVYASSAIERLLGPKKPVLTPTQLEVLSHARHGRSSWVIAKVMEIGEDNVNYHLKRCRAALGVRTRLEAIQKAVELGLIA